MAKLVAVGKCASCGKEFVRPSSCTHAVCDCKSAVAVPLELAIILPPRYLKKLEIVSKHSGVAVEDLTEALLKTISKATLRGLAVTQNVTESRVTEVPFQVYQQECKNCLYREKTLTVYADYLRQAEPMRIICAASNRCEKVGRYEKD